MKIKNLLKIKIKNFRVLLISLIFIYTPQLYPYFNFKSKIIH